MIEFTKQFIKDRFSERSTVNGLLSIGFGLALLFASQLVPFIAYAMIGYGAYVMFTEG